MTMRGDTYLDQIFAFGFGDQRLKLGGGEGVDQTRFGDHQQEDLCAREDGEFVRLSALPPISPHSRHRFEHSR